MKTLSTALAVALALSLPMFADANLYSGPTVDYNPGVSISATPQTITMGESTRIEFYAPLASTNVTSDPEPDMDENCTADFAFTEAPYQQIPGSNWGTMGVATESPTATKTYTVTCRLFQSESAQGVTYRYDTNSVTVTVNPPAGPTQPELTAGGITPTTAVYGGATTLSATVSNSGTATVAGFQNLFQRATDSSGTGATDIGTYTRSSALAEAGTFAATLSYSFTSAGTWYVRACADKSSGMDAGTVAESSEDNNCGAWTAVTVTASYQCNDGLDNDGAGGTDYQNDPSCTDATDNSEDGVISPTLACNITPTTVAVGTVGTYTTTGGSGTYNWHTSGQANCSGTSTQTCTFPQPATYTMSVDNGGTPVSCPWVTAGCSGIAAVDLDAEELRVNEGESTTLSLTASATGAASCTLSGTNGLSETFIPSACALDEGSVASGPITTQTFFTLACGSESKTIIVNVSANQLEF